MVSTCHQNLAIILCLGTGCANYCTLGMLLASLLFSRTDIYGYKVPSNYTSKITPMLLQKMIKFSVLCAGSFCLIKKLHEIFPFRSPSCSSAQHGRFYSKEESAIFSFLLSGSPLSYYTCRNSNLKETQRFLWAFSALISVTFSFTCQIQLVPSSLTCLVFCA